MLGLGLGLGLGLVVLPRSRLSLLHENDDRPFKKRKNAPQLLHLC